MPTMRDADHRLALSGLDGANPLGFLAALGILAALSEADPTIKLGWRATARWTPFLSSTRPLEEAMLLDHLATRLRGKAVDPKKEAQRAAAQKQFDAAKTDLKNTEKRFKTLGLRGKERDGARKTDIAPFETAFKVAQERRQTALKEAVPSPELALGQRPDCIIAEFRDHARSVRADAGPNNRRAVDLLAAFGAEVSGDAADHIEPTPFCFITGSGHQWFLDTARDLMSAVSKEKLREALFESWTYRDEKLTMRWDPLDDRRYALMDRDPTASDNKSTTVWMANLLGYVGLTFFPCAPASNHTETAGWTRRRDQKAFSWPLWLPPLGRESVRSLLLHPALTALTSKPTRREFRDELLARGVDAILCCLRIQVGNPPLNKINFSPAFAL